MYPKSFLLICLFFFNCSFFSNDSYYIDGPNTISKEDAKKKIAKTIFLKTVSCGYNAARATAISELGNEEIEPQPFFQIGGGSNSHSIIYDSNALDHCLKSIILMPCPSNGIETNAGDEEYVKTLVFTRYQSCTFQPIDNWEINEMMKGRL
ncbi:hypothetical protein [Leptospira kanakyensis]|uniref:hypothetical protein n=1 Tax=Leptospira kanakyensis TaxID=2484968 RepID=UPI00223E738B|nr:hypothetical protein [Leptospira kanakyensis]MCW7468728.1 hypothetical protein [Leptospira kanakyensis]